MPEHAKVGVFEDKESVIEEIIKLLSANGHTVIEVVRCLRDARPAIERMIIAGVQVITVDGMLLGGDMTDGEEIVKLVKARASYVPTIGLATGVVRGVTYNSRKVNLGSLGPFITKL